MADPFATAIGTLFAGPRAVAAIYLPGDDFDLAQAVTVIRSQPSALESFAGIVVETGTEAFEIRGSDVSRPAIGDVIEIGEDRFEVSIDPLPDRLGLAWIVLADLMR